MFFFRYLAEYFLRRDGIDVLFDPGADLVRLYKLIPANIADYKVSFSYSSVHSQNGK